LPRRAKGDQQVDLPTYTSIWRIEKRLYKLYDFRLPMPLPIGQVTVFAAIAVPYLVLLTVLGLPFNHTLIWLYILPPGLATWLVTRPVLESKRLPELIKSQLRYLSEPKVLCRMVPLSERDVVFVSGRVWHPRAGRRGAEVTAETQADAGTFEPDDEYAGAAARESTQEPRPAGLRRGPLPPGRSREPSVPGRPAWPYATGHAATWPGRRPQDRPAAPAPRPAADDRISPRSAGRMAAESSPPPPRAVERAEFRLVASGRPAPRDGCHTQTSRAATPAGRADPAEPERAAGSSSPVPNAGSPEPPDGAPADDSGDAPVYVGQHTRQEPSDIAGQEVPEPTEPGPAPEARPARPAVTVVGASAGKTAAPSVERALAGPAARRGDLRPGRVSVVPGGHRPGKPDLLQRDRSRARMPIDLKPRIVVLGCTVGAGQTMTALLTGEVLASLRPDQVAVMDLNPGPGSLARRAEGRPALSQAALTGRSRLAVIGPRAAAVNPAATPAPRDPAIDAITFEAATDRYDMVLADPATVAVPKLLAVADQLVLVAPASAAAPGAIAMTFEWLEAHDQSALAARAVMVLNGVSRRSAAAVEQAERVCAGRCRAIVRIPWDDQLQALVAKRTLGSGPGSQMRQHWTGVLNPATAAGYTALAGVLVASLAGQGQDAQPAHAGQARP
jgi:MinD-like ATPase involved in chromosome partitioning or flagellar assembly